jgi:rubredoxin
MRPYASDGIGIKTRTTCANHKEIQMAQYMCGPCGWIYDEEFGDPEHGLAPGTKFEDIPDDWKCPECGVGKEDFYLLDFVI